MHPSNNIASTFDRLSIGAFFLACAVALGLLDLTPRDTSRGVAILFPPWTNGADAMSRASGAGATLVRTGRYPFIVVVKPEAKDFMTRIFKEGALAVLDPGTFAGCLSNRAGA